MKEKTFLLLPEIHKILNLLLWLCLCHTLWTWKAHHQTYFIENSKKVWRRTSRKCAVMRKEDQYTQYLRSAILQTIKWIGDGIWCCSILSLYELWATYYAFVDYWRQSECAVPSTMTGGSQQWATRCFISPREEGRQFPDSIKGWQRSLVNPDANVDAWLHAHVAPFICVYTQKCAHAKIIAILLSILSFHGLPKRAGKEEIHPAR